MVFTARLIKIKPKRVHADRDPHANVQCNFASGQVQRHTVNYFVS